MDDQLKALYTLDAHMSILLAVLWQSFSDRSNTLFCAFTTTINRVRCVEGRTVPL